MKRLLLMVVALIGATVILLKSSTALADSSFCRNGITTSYSTRIPSAGMSTGAHIYLNPRLLADEMPAVRRFIWAHECGHQLLGASELAADCYATKRGKREGWLRREHLREVCASWHDDPETDTHPSGRARCANLRRCFNSSP